MESRIEAALERHHKGFNCSQSVACTYCDLLGYKEEDVFVLSEALGFGMGNMQGTCGALSGAMLLLGMMNSKGLGQTASKRSSYALGRQLGEAFRAKNGATICRELKGVETGKVLRSCDGCVEDACRLFEEAWAAREAEQEQKLDA